MSRLPSWIEEIRARLESPPPRRLPAHDARHASVLVPLFVAQGQLWTLLTRRSQELPHHRGQVAFPGGGRETGEESWQAALRESEEEIGLPTRLVLRLGELDEVGTPSGFRIVPCVGAIPHPFEPRPNPAEIAEVFAAPVTAFTQAGGVEEREVVLNGSPRALRVYRVGEHRVWGVTARIVQNLVARLGLERSREAR